MNSHTAEVHPAAEATPSEPDRPATARRQPSSIALLRMLLGRYVLVGIRQPVFGFIFPIVFPTVLVIFVRGMFQRVADLPGFPLSSYTAYLAPGVVMLIPMIGAGYGATTLIEEIQSGYVDRLRLQGVTSGQILVAKTLFEMIRILPAAIIVMVLLVALGAPLRSGVGTALALLALMCVWSAAYSCLFYLLAVRTLNPQAPIALLPLVLPVMFFSQALMPSLFLSGWLRAAIKVNPFSQVVSAATTLTYGKFHIGDLIAGFVVPAVLFAALHVWLRVMVKRRIGE